MVVAGRVGWCWRGVEIGRSQGLRGVGPRSGWGRPGAGPVREVLAMTSWDRVGLDGLGGVIKSCSGSKLESRVEVKSASEWLVG